MVLVFCCIGAISAGIVQQDSDMQSACSVTVNFVMAEREGKLERYQASYPICNSRLGDGIVDSIA